MSSENEVETLTPYDPTKVLSELVAGHQRYRDGGMEHPNTGYERREEKASSQNPKVCILACADSRVPPEIIFDQGIGDVFVVRVAGNFADADNQASLEYALQHFSPQPAVIVVLGHERCGAVKAAAILFDPSAVPPKDVEEFNHHPKASTNLEALVTRLRPVVDKSKSPYLNTDRNFTTSLYWRYMGQAPDEKLNDYLNQLTSSGKKREDLEKEFSQSDKASQHGPVTDRDFVTSLYWRYLGQAPDGELEAYIGELTSGEKTRQQFEDEFPPRLDACMERLDEAIFRNVRDNVAILQANPVIKEAIEKNRVLVIGARYDLDTGDLDWLTKSPPLIFDAKTLTLKAEEVVTIWAGHTPTGEPRYTDNNGPNDKPAVIFEYGDRMDDATLSPSETGDWVVVAVINPDNAHSRLSLVDTSDGVGPQLLIDAEFNYELNGAGGTGTKRAGSGPDGWDIVIVDSRLNRLYINSPTPNATGGNAVSFSVTTNFHILHNRSANETFQGMVAELRVYNDPAEFGGDFARLYNDIRAKWID